VPSGRGPIVLLNLVVLRLVDPVTRGDPESPLRCTSKSDAKLAEALREMGHVVVSLVEGMNRPAVSLS
jgi:hypothetical protein